MQQPTTARCLGRLEDRPPLSYGWSARCITGSTGVSASPAWHCVTPPGALPPHRACHHYVQLELTQHAARAAAPWCWSLGQGLTRKLPSPYGGGTVRQATESLREEVTPADRPLPSRITGRPAVGKAYWARPTAAGTSYRRHLSELSTSPAQPPSPDEHRPPSRRREDRTAGTERVPAPTSPPHTNRVFFVFLFCFF